MDKVIAKKKWPWQRRLLYFGLPLGVLILAYLVYAASGAKSLKVDSKRLSIGTVIQGSFEDNIPITGTVEPLASVFITAAEGGNVEEIFVEDGQMVEKGKALLRLSNANLMLDFMNRETQIIEQINNLRNTRLTIEQNKRGLKDQLIDLNYQLVEAQRQFALDSTLYRDSVIADNDYRASYNSIHYLRAKIKFTRENLKREEAIQSNQLNRIDGSISLMERNLEAIRRNLENLTIKAPISGQLTGFNHYLGETKQRGENLGQVDQLSGFMMRCNVDEFYLGRVQNGQLGSFDFNGAAHQLEVQKVLPQVSNGQFQIEMHFSDSVPSGIRRGQSRQIRLALSEAKPALMVPRGGFYQSTGGAWVFLVQEDGTAIKHPVEMGRQNSNYVEILAGLNPGDQIITNSYSPYGEAELLLIEN